MFGWDFHNSKADRMKLFLFLLAIFLLVGFTFLSIYRYMDKGKRADGQPLIGVSESKKEADTSDSTYSESKLMDSTKGPNEYDQTEHFSKKELATTKSIAIQFVTAFHSYNADQPQAYLEKSKPFMTVDLYQKMERNGRREVLERSYLTVESTEVTPVVNKSSTVARWNVIAKGEAKSNDNKIKQIEDWYLVGLRKVNGEWRVEDVRVNVPN